MRRLDQEKTVKPDSLILAPDNQINKNIRCEVLSVGKGLTIAGKRIKLGVKPGDIVIVRQWSGTQVMPLEDKSLIIDKIDVVEAIDTGDTLKPLRDRVVIKEDPTEEKIGLIWIPETVQEGVVKTKTGTVVKTGPGRISNETGETLPCEVSKGDKVYYSKWTGTKVEMKNGEEFLLISEKEILGVKA